MPGELVPIVLFIGAVVMVIFIRKYMNTERMSMIEKGVSPKDFQQSSKYGAIRFGFLFIGAGIGLLIGSFLHEVGLEEDVAYFSMIFIFGGLGLVASHLYIQKQEKDA